MKVGFILIIGVTAFGTSIANIAFPTEIPNKSIAPSSNVTTNMYYHGTPAFYWTLTGKNWCIAGYFEPAKFNTNTNFRIKTIGFMGYLQNGSAKIYIFLAETGSKPGHPDCTPPEFTKKKYGPYDGHINNSYPNYDDLDVSGLNWNIKKSEIDSQSNKRFWVIYHFPTSPPPYPISDNCGGSKNSIYYCPGIGWTTSISG